MKRVYHFIKRINNVSLYKRKGQAVKINILSLTFFLTLSASLWLFIALRKNYTSEIIYPITFVNPPKGVVVTNNTINLFVTLKADGFTFVRLSNSNQTEPHEIDLTANRLMLHKTAEGLYLSSYVLNRKLSEAISKNSSIISISPDTLFLNLSQANSKKVPINLVHDITFVKSFGQSDEILITPDSILISGPQPIIERISSVSTLPQLFSDVKDSLQFSTTIQAIPNVIFERTFCNIVIPVDQFTESKMEVPIVASGLAENVDVKFFPAEVSLSFQVAIGKLNDFEASDFKAESDFSAISTSNQPDKVKVRLTNHPKYIRNVTYTPLMVDYILESKTK